METGFGLVQWGHAGTGTPATCIRQPPKLRLSIHAARCHPQAKLIWDYLRTPRFNPLSMTRDNKNVLAFNLSFLFHRTDLLAEAMAQLFHFEQAGQLRPPQTTTYPLREVARAHRDLESGQTVGKLVLTLD